MGDRFRTLNDESNQNIFKTSTKYHSNKSVKGNTLKDLIEKSKNTRQGLKQKNDKYCKSNKPLTPKKEEFKVLNEEFPILSENTKTIDGKTIDTNYKDKIEKVKEEKREKDKNNNLKCWTYLPSEDLKTKDNVSNIDISPYYNPMQSLKILVEREEYREELNDILGDISPYWITYEPDDTELSEYDEISEYDEEEEEYVEDW